MRLCSKVLTDSSETRGGRPYRFMDQQIGPFSIYPIRPSKDCRLDAIEIDKGSGASIQQQLYDRLRAAIIEGRIPSGERVPSTRSLAAQLGIARGTIDIAYARLTSEGYLVARGQRGTIVSPELRRTVIAAEAGARPVATKRPASDSPPL